ncbi:MAG: hypothetical protein NC339_06925 [Muribaculaceae bacterium]|nr:hypothetical protein [Muribaculaceae bacterium]
MKTRFIFSLLMLFHMSMWGANGKPDFAFPQTVSRQADAQLGRALKSGDDVEAIRELMDLYISGSMINPDSITPLLARIEVVSREVKMPAALSVIKILQAEIYKELYFQQKWKYDRRNLPMSPLPELYTEWSGSQFRYRIEELTDSALMCVKMQPNDALSEFKSVITQDFETRIYYPTVYDFVVNKAIDILSSQRDYTSKPSEYKIVGLYNDLMNMSVPGSAPYIKAQLGRLLFLSDCRNSYDTRFRQMMELFLANNKSEYAGDILCNFDIPAADSADRKVLYDAIENFLSSFPQYWRRGCLENMLRQMAERGAGISAPQITGPGVENSLKINLRNLNTVVLNVYDVSSSSVADNCYRQRRGSSLGTPIDAVRLSAPGRTVPFSVDTVVNYTFKTPGLYIIVPEFEGMNRSANKSWQKIYVSNLCLGQSRFDETLMWALDARDGAPLQGVDLYINYDSNSNMKGDVLLGKTSGDGSLVVKSGSGTVTARRGSDRFAYPQYAYTFRSNSQKDWQKAFQGYSSLPLYHQGDTVRWCAVAYEYRLDERRVCAGKDFSAILVDASGVQLDTLSLTSDQWGRISGQFVLPTSGLTGNYNIRIDNRWGVVNFMVSDYKLPTFLFDDTKALRSVPAESDVTLSGIVRTYSGFPLNGAKISVELSVAQRPRWWFASQEYQFYTTDTIAGADGHFEVTVPKSVLMDSPVPDGFYTASITALSPTGESQTTKIRFTVGDRYIIKAKIADNIEVVKDRISLAAQIVDSNDSIVSIPVDYELMNMDSTVLSRGSIANGKGSVDMAGIPSGRYIFRLSLPQPYRAETLTFNSVIYRATDSLSPLPGTLLWSPEMQLTTDARGQGSWLYATDCDTHLLVMLTSGDSLLSREWVKAPSGMHKLEVSLPVGVDRAYMTVAATGLFRTDNKAITLVRGNSEKGLRIVLDTFRDRLTPGSSEKWTVRVTDLDGRGREAAVVADMYNAALDALVSSDWNFRPAYSYPSKLYWNSAPFGSSISAYVNGKNTPGKACPSLTDPTFETYGYGLVQQRLYGAMLTSKVAARGASDNIIVENEMMYKAEAVTADSGSSDEVTVEEESTPAEQPTTDVEYRDSNVPLAFFMPQLSTGTDGTLQLEFNLPNANTTWGLRAVAWTDSVLTASYSCNMVASKSVMVQPNLPRFLRSGDVAQLPCLVMNATDSAMTAKVTVELFDPNSGHVTDSLERILSLSPVSSDTVNIRVNAPYTGAFVGYRVKAQSLSGGSDGEQCLIPILPAVTPVIETVPFYMAPDITDFSIDIKSIPADGRQTLQLCENPVWYVVTALPGLLDSQATTSPEAMRSLFSASVAAGLLRDNPAIAEAIEYWNTSDKSASTLTSMLQQNEELKMVLLNATPWMLNARSDTERMSRLCLIFDKKLVRKTIDENIELLSKLFVEDGWSWYQQYPSRSSWATMCVLTLSGRLSCLGYLPQSVKLKEMLTKALQCDTRQTLEAYRKNPKGDFTSYLVLHDMFANNGVEEPNKVIADAAIGYILKNWKHSSLTTKAIYAGALYRHDYKSMARTILESIRQFEQRSADKGVWFPSIENDMIESASAMLEAFATIEPGCVEIDGIRQWLVAQKGAQDWGSSVAATDVIAVFLQSSARWIAPARGCDVTLDGEALTPSEVARYTGEFTMPLPTHGGELNIVKHADTPAWGAVYSQFNDSITQVKSCSCPELAIEKSLLLNQADGSVEPVHPSTDIKVGDRLTVKLTLRVDMDMDYVVLSDERSAALEPVDQLPGRMLSEGLYFYRENLDAETRIFINHLPRGLCILTYDVWVNTQGDFASGIVSAQSQYAPRYSAHSAGGELKVGR